MTTPPTIGGAIRFMTSEPAPTVDAIVGAGIIPGIKVDTGAQDLAGHPGERVTEGLDGLRERLLEYSRMGARFAKWRAVIAIGDGLPSRGCIEANAMALARYAALCQEVGVVPIVEPEVLMAGDHSLERCGEVTEEVLRTVFDQFYAQRVMLEGLILKPNMVLPGSTCPTQRSEDEIADATVKCLLRAVPAAVPGIAFLSGGQSGTRTFGLRSAHCLIEPAATERRDGASTRCHGRRMSRDVGGRASASAGLCDLAEHRACLEAAAAVAKARLPETRLTPFESPPRSAAAQPTQRLRHESADFLALTRRRRSCSVATRRAALPSRSKGTNPCCEA